jgi:hypothetical protein
MVVINDHGSVGRYNNCPPLPGSMTARQWVRADLVNVVFSRAMLTSEVLDGLDAVNKGTDVRTFGDAVDVGHDLIDNRMGALGGDCSHPKRLKRCHRSIRRL